MRRLCSLLAGVTAIVLAVAPAVQAAAPAPPIPPDLQALLARSAQQQIPYEIVQSSNALDVGTGFSDTSATTEVRLSPPELATASGTGAQAMAERLTGGELYLEIPGLARVAHGRRWLRGTPRQLGVSVSQLLEAAGAVPGHPSSGLNNAAAVTALLHEVSTLRELGPSVVDGEPVTEFLATISFAQLTGTPAAGVASLDQDVDLQLYFAADGLLKRLSLNLDEIVHTTTDVLSDTVPVVVHRPPAREVVAYSPALVRALLESQSSSLGAPSPVSETVPFDVTAWLARGSAGASPFGPLGDGLSVDTR